MDTTGLIIGAENILIGLLFIILARPMILGRPGMRPLLGPLSRPIRSEEKRGELNIFAGRQFQAWGSLVLAAGIIALLIDLDNDLALALLFASAPALLIIAAMRIYIHSRFLTRQ
jgi:hypothetical protein